MPLQITDSGLQTQTLQEIIDEYNNAFRTKYNIASFKVEEGSVAGKFIGIAAEREALLQQLLLAVLQTTDPNNATGVLLDILSAVTNTYRKDATKSKSSSFLATGTPGTIITDGRQFQNIYTKDLWNVIDGPFTIGGGGTIAITAEANETGPVVFSTSPSGDWSIILGVAGWTSVEATADIDPEDTGRSIESNEDLRERRKAELLVNGNDLDGIRALVLQVDGVLAADTFENQSCLAPSPEGIPPGAFETVVDGGDDTSIANAIYTGKPPGAQAYGTTTVTVSTSSGDSIDIGFTRPSDVDLWVLVVCDTTGAEGQLPPNAEQVVLDTVLDYGNSNFNTPGYDVVPQSFIGTVFAALRDDQGRDSITSVDIQMSLDNGPGTAPAYPPGFPAPGAGVDPYTTSVRPMTIRQRGDFDSSRIGVTIL